MAAEVSWKPNNFQVSQSSKTKATAQAIDQLASRVVAEILDLVSDIDADQIQELADSDLVNVIVVSVFQMCTNIILNTVKLRNKLWFCK